MTNFRDSQRYSQGIARLSYSGTVMLLRLVGGGLAKQFGQSLILIKCGKLWGPQHEWDKTLQPVICTHIKGKNTPTLFIMTKALM